MNSLPWCLGQFLGSFISIKKLVDYMNQPTIVVKKSIQNDEN
jgi:hypothetical protein